MYNPPLSPGRFVIFDKNEKEKRPEDTPGPGTYEAPTYVGQYPKYGQ